MVTASDVTGLLSRWDRSDTKSQERLLAAVYRELHRLASGRLRRGFGSHTLQPTALVHEAYLRLVCQEKTEWRDRAQFLAISSEIMRRVLLDHSRRRRAQKRGPTVVTLNADRLPQEPSQNLEVEALDSALRSLADLNARQARVVELKYFGGLTIDEISKELDVSPATVKRDWGSAKAWLLRELRKD
ncbi:MAG: ECF-type sigma factor [Acidobacteriota bacterium]